jgi:hypothetical protein
MCWGAGCGAVEVASGSGRDRLRIRARNEHQLCFRVASVFWSTAHLSAAEREIERIEARRKKLVESIMEGVPARQVVAVAGACSRRYLQLWSGAA